MVNAVGIQGINPLKMLNAVNAFKATEKANEVKTPEISDGIDINDSNVLKNQDTNEIKQFAKIVGEDELSNDDIKYGITYGRSVIADYVI